MSSKICKSQYSYQCVGYHLDVVLNDITSNITSNIDNVIKKKLPKIHKGVSCDCDGALREAKKQNTQKNKNLCAKNAKNAKIDCAEMSKTISTCVKCRKTHIKMWEAFVDDVVTNIIPTAVQSRIEHIKHSGKVRERYKDSLSQLLMAFGNILKTHFINLQKMENNVHQSPIELMKQYQLDILRSNSSLEARDSDDCVTLLSNAPNRVVNNFGRQYGIPNVRKMGKKLLAQKICEELIY